MTGTWNTRPRKGERSKETARSDQEHAIRKEYGDAGELRGLVGAWKGAIAMADEYNRRAVLETHDFSVMADGVLACAEAIAVMALAHAPKRARVDLADAGASVEYIDAMVRKLAELRAEGVV